jgi:hypothetical protein
MIVLLTIERFHRVASWRASCCPARMRPWRAAIGVALLFAIPRCSCSNDTNDAEVQCSALPPGPHEHLEAVAGCLGGESCQPRCDLGFADCDGNQANGCELDTSNLPPHEQLGTGWFSSTCNTTCVAGWMDCDKNAANGCETQGNSCFPQSDASKDASTSSGELLVTLTGAPRGLTACAGRIFYFDDDQLHMIDESSLTITIVTVSKQLPTQGLACDGSYVYWTTLPDVDAGAPNGSLMRATIDGTKNEVLATDLDPGPGIDARPSGPVYFLARSGFGPGANVVAAQIGDAGVALDTWMPTTEGQPRPFAWSASDDWSLAAGLIHRRPLGADASSPWRPAPNATSLLADDADTPYIVLASPSADAGDAAAPTDDFALLDDDAGLVALGASLPSLIATTSNAATTIAASDDTVYTVSLPQAISTVIATTTNHVVDVAYDSTWAVWTTRGGTNAQVWRAKVP